MLIYETSFDAEHDLQAIIDYTIENHGFAQMQTYVSQLENCAENLAKKQGTFRELEVKNTKVRVKHCQHHYIFGFDRVNQPFKVIAIFHERMDLMLRLRGRLS